jgi:hypothetical protein
VVEPPAAAWPSRRAIPLLMKLTYPEDFAMAERSPAGGAHHPIGQGFDAHRWGPGEGLAVRRGDRP